MAQDFYDNYPVAKQTFEEASDAIGEDLTTICFQEDPRLDLTEFTQPAILTAEIAMMRVLKEAYNFSPSYYAGHSLGEYTALVAADVMPFTDAVQIVRKRGALMQAAVPAGVGGMAALILEGIENVDYRSIVEKHGAEVANYNSMDQVVISGKLESVQGASGELETTFKEQGINVVPLAVSAPFHSSLMAGIEPEFRAFVDTFAAGFKPENAGKVVSNFTAEFHTEAGLLDNLVKQISGSVRWIQNMKLLGEKSGSIYEVGPNRPLGKFFKTVGLDVTSVINLRSAKKAFEA